MSDNRNISTMSTHEAVEAAIEAAILLLKYGPITAGQVDRFSFGDFNGRTMNGHSRARVIDKALQRLKARKVIVFNRTERNWRPTDAP